MRIEHIAINVPEVEKHAQWYVNHLGMTIVRQLEEMNIHFMTDESSHVVMELYTNPEVTMPDYASMEAEVFHIAFSADDIEAERDRLVSAGAESLTDIRTTPAGDRLTFLRDPWGVCLQLAQRSKPLI